MQKKIGIGHQDFSQLIRNAGFYIDKTGFIKEWWEQNDVVTLITRPRWFGKTLTMKYDRAVLLCALCRPE